MSNQARSFRSGAVAVILAFVAALAGCGGDSPTSPSGEVVLRGTFVGGGTASASSQGAAKAASPIVVTVQENPAITATVGADGSFALRGLPAGSFTLVFTQNGVVLGTLVFSEVAPNQEITITVQVVGSAIVLLDEQRTGIGHGDLEIEGLVEAVLVLNPVGESRFTIAGRTVLAVPGQTAIRQGNTAKTVADVTVGRRVHVKGVNAQSPAGAVLALEIKLQGDDLASPPPQAACAPGSNAEVEGLITAKAGSAITVNQQAKGDFLCETSGSTRIRKGNTTYTFDQLQIGWRVHVKGTMQGLSGSACRVTATEIMVQNN